ncbi:MAG: AMP-binding protein [Muribaculaceae bacterium]
MIRIDGMTEAANRFLSEWDNGEPFVTAHTSGSTGKPKEIRLRKLDMIASAEATCRFFGIDGASRLALPLSADYIAGKMMIVRAIVSGASLYIEQPSNRPSLGGENGEDIDLLAIVPSQLEWLVANPRIASRVKAVIIGGAPLTPAQEAQAASLSWEAYATYGMTETCSHVALRKLGRADRLFHALPEITFSTDSRGCLVIGMPRFSFGRIVTNDIVRLESPVAFEWLGRYDNVINSGGIKIFPEEVEKRLDFIGRPYFIIGRPHPKWGEEAVLYIEGEVGDVDAAAIMEKARTVLDRRSVPKEVIAVSRFERTDSGKVKRRLY